MRMEPASRGSRLPDVISRLALLVAATALFGMIGCGEETSSFATADCAQEVEHGNVRYTERGFSKAAVEPFQRVVGVPCLDTGVLPAPDAPTEYRESFGLRGQDPDEVLAVPVERGVYRVMLSNDLGDDRAEAILAMLHSHEKRPLVRGA